MISEWELLARVVVASVLAGLIGWDREAANKPAGIRTHALVGAGSALFVAASMLILGEALAVDARGDAAKSGVSPRQPESGSLLPSAC